MLTATVETLVTVSGGTLLAGDPAVFGNDLTIDSRTATPGCIFVALPGEHVDGHHFLEAALASGARVFLVTRQDEVISAFAEKAAVEGGAVILVGDGVEALHDLAAWHRSRLQATVIGVTGSNGKTTTKDFLSAVLSTTKRVVATEGNRNNELGLPLTILTASVTTDVLVLEMGMRGLGQIARLAATAKPDLGLVTNVGTSHIELLGTQDAVATAKAELVRAIPADGAVFLNGDDGYSEVMAADSAAPVITYGLSERCEIRATDIELDRDSRASFTLVAPQGSGRVGLPIPGRHNVYNALAAAAVALHEGVSFDQIASGLESASVSGMRMQFLTTPDDVSILNDAYNANPTSMKAAIETLASMSVTGKRIAVLGDMGELGSLSELAHFQVGEAVAHSAIDTLITVGPRAVRIADGARAAGMPANAVSTYATVAELLPRVSADLAPGDTVLVKASRVMGLEAVVEGIVSPVAG